MSRVMTAAEALDAGLVQEANRLFCHLHGYRLGVVGGRFIVIDDDGEPRTLGGLAAAEKAEAMAQRRVGVEALRAGLFGDDRTVEPVPGWDDAVPARFVVDSDEAAGAFEAAVEQASRIVASAALTAAPLFDHADAAVRYVNDEVMRGVHVALDLLWRGARVEPGGVVRLTPLAPPPESDGLDRTRHLLRLIIGDGECDGLQAQHGQLYPEEVDEARALAEAVDAGTATPEQVARVEVLFGMVQPSMRYFRGDRMERARFGAVADRVTARVARYIAGQTEAARFIAGNIGAGDLRDLDAVRAVLDEQAEPLREQVKALEAELAAARSALAPLEAAAERLQAVAA